MKHTFPITCVITIKQTSPLPVDGSVLPHKLAEAVLAPSFKLLLHDKHLCLSQ